MESAKLITECLSSCRDKLDDHKKVSHKGTSPQYQLQKYTYQFELILCCEFLVKYFSTCNCSVDLFVVAGHKVECIKYDVSTQPVSIHVPVTRLLAGLLAQISRWNVPIGLKELHHKVIKQFVFQ